MVSGAVMPDMNTLEQVLTAVRRRQLFKGEQRLAVLEQCLAKTRLLRTAGKITPQEYMKAQGLVNQALVETRIWLQRESGTATKDTPQSTKTGLPTDDQASLTDTESGEGHYIGSVSPSP